MYNKKLKSKQLLKGGLFIFYLLYLYLYRTYLTYLTYTYLPDLYRHYLTYLPTYLHKVHMRDSHFISSHVKSKSYTPVLLTY